MGVDALIEFEPLEGFAVSQLPFPGDTYEADGGVLEFCPSPGNGRYWSPDYRRGTFSVYLAVLAELLALKTVGRVWYRSDSDEGKPRGEPLTTEALAVMMAQYVELGAWWHPGKGVGQ